MLPTCAPGTQVWKAQQMHGDKEVHALKVVFWGNPDVKEHHRRILRKEVQVLHELQHCNIVKLIKEHETPQHLVMVLEYLKGGGLLEHLIEVEHYSEGQAAHLFSQILSAVRYMHDREVPIMHRDIKVCSRLLTLLQQCVQEYAVQHCMSASEAHAGLHCNAHNYEHLAAA